MISIFQLQALMRRADVGKWYAPLCAALTKYFVTTPQRQAAFLANAAEESAELTSTEENLNYTSAASLKMTFPTHFDAMGEDDAWGYVKQPERIANRVYASRLGNGPEASGDGWRFRGRGLFQLTGRSEYRAYGREQDPDYVSTVAGATDSAGWFWSGEGLNVLADAGDFRGIVKKINGGYNGWVQRKAYYDVAIGLLK